MYVVFTYIYHKNQPNVGIYTIHGPDFQVQGIPSQEAITCLSKLGTSSCQRMMKGRIQSSKRNAKYFGSMKPFSEGVFGKGYISSQQGIKKFLLEEGMISFSFF